MIEIFQRFTFKLQRFYYRYLPRIVLVARRSWNLDLFDGNHLARCCVECKIDLAVRSLANELTADPAEDS